MSEFDKLQNQLFRLEAKIDNLQKKLGVSGINTIESTKEQQEEAKRIAEGIVSYSKEEGGRRWIKRP